MAGRESVRVAHGNVHVIIVVLEFGFEAQRMQIVELLELLLLLIGETRTHSARTIPEYLGIGHTILVISYIIPCSIPAELVGCGILLGVKEGHHAVIVERLVFHEVDNVEDIFLVLSSIAHFEIEPLREVPGVVVGLHY